MYATTWHVQNSELLKPTAQHAFQACGRHFLSRLEFMEISIIKAQGSEES